MAEENYNPQPPLTTQVTPQMGEYNEYSRLNGDGDQVRSYTGMGIFNPALELEEGNFNLVGMNDGVLQAGISADDGTFLAGGGNVVLDGDGISLDGTVGIADTSANIKWKNADGTVVAEIHADQNAQNPTGGTYTAFNSHGFGTYPYATMQLITDNDTNGATSGMAISQTNNLVDGYAVLSGSSQLYATDGANTSSIINIEPQEIRLDSNTNTILGSINRIACVGASSDLWNTTNNAPFTTDTVSGGRCNKKASEAGYHFGILTLGSGGTSSNSGGRIGTLDNDPFVVDSGYPMGAEFLIRPLDKNANHRVVMGFFDSASSFSSMTPTNCNIITLTGDGTNFTAKHVNRVAGSGVATTLGTVSVNVWIRVQIIYEGGDVTYKIYESGDAITYQATSTVIPTAPMGLAIKAFRTNATGADIIDVDRIDFYPGGTA